MRQKQVYAILVRGSDGKTIVQGKKR